ncbi:MAG: glycosyltransferase family 2 protein [Cyanobacteriota bacterium]|nr:glycosyltransferase family 2 protein [Cyanobacteriota bacterium]
MKLTFSIVITTHNCLDRLERAIESALAQSIPCEIILIDDGSSDGTEAYGRRLGKPVVYYRHRVRLGYGESLNVGVELAQGQWIKFLNDADRLEPTCLAQMKEAIEQCPKAALLSCQAIEIRPGDGMHRTPPFGNDRVVCIPQEDIHYQMLFEHLCFGCPAQVAVRRDAFLRAGGWSSLNGSGYEALESWTRMAQYGDAIFINQPLSYYRSDPSKADEDHLSPEQIETKLTVDRHIYQRLPANYRTQLADNPELQQFLKLHWSLVSLQNDIEPEPPTCSPAQSPPALFAWSRLARAIYKKIQGLERDRKQLQREPESLELEPIEQSK